VKISVIIPVYNASAHLEVALKSALSQSDVTLEVLALDDGSTDASAEILARCAAADRRLSVVRQASNAGQGAARNRGLELATGEYVYFMDADDALAEPDALVRLAEVMDRDRLDVLFFDAITKVDAGLAVPDSVVRAADYIRTHDYSGVHTGRELFAKFLKNREYCVSPCLMMLRRSFVEERHLRFPESRIFYEDNIFMTRVLLAAERASHRPWQLYVRKVHAGTTVTSRPTLRHLRGYLACYRDVCQLLRDGAWDRWTRLALADRRAVYKLHVRRLADAHPSLVAAAEREMPPDELVALRQVLVYPLWEKAVNAVRCLRDRGVAFTVRRILFGRQP